MKNLHYILILIMTISCNREKPIPVLDTEIVVPVDKTDKMLRPNPQDIIRLSGLDEDMWKGVKIVITEITDISANNAKVFFIEGESELQGYSEVRKGRVLQLKKELTSYLNLPDTMISKEKSQISHALTGMLNNLSKSKALKRYALVYSDCMENSFVSFYMPKTKRMLEESPDTIIRSLEQETPIMDLSGIDIYFRYIPRDYEQDLLYRTTSNCFITMYRKHNAKVWDNTVPLP